MAAYSTKHTFMYIKYRMRISTPNYKAKNRNSTKKTDKKIVYLKR